MKATLEAARAAGSIFARELFSILESRIKFRNTGLTIAASGASPPSFYCTLGEVDPNILIEVWSDAFLGTTLPTVWGGLASTCPEALARYVRSTSVYDPNGAVLNNDDYDDRNDRLKPQAVARLQRFDLFKQALPVLELFDGFGGFGIYARRGEENAFEVAALIARIVVTHAS